MEHKTLPVTGIKTGGELPDGEFTGIASAFDVVDSYGDIVRKGAYTKAVEPGEVLPLMWQHDYKDPRSYIGEVVEAYETDTGLEIKGRIDLDSEYGAATWRNVKGRRVKGLSIGYAIRDSVKNEHGGRDLLDIKLHEISVCLTPANPQALISKSAPTALLRARTQLLRMKVGTAMETKTSDGGRLSKDRDTQLAAAQSIIDTATELQRDLTGDEQAAVEEHLDAAQKANERIERAAKSAEMMAQLNEMAMSLPSIDPITGEPYAGTPAADGHLAMTGHHAKALASRIIKEMPRHGTKALAAGQQTTTVQLLPGVIAQGQPALSLLDVLPSRVTPPVYTYLRQSSRSLNAAPVATGGTKPTSTVGVQSIQNRLRVVAHVSEQIDHFTLADNTNLQSFVTQELVYGLRRALETQIISGDGVGENFLGILNTSGIQTVAFATSALISVRKALTVLDTAGYSATTIVLHASDWEAIELLAATQGSTDTRGVPIDAVERKLWGTRVVLNQGLGAKVGLVIGDGAVTVDSDGGVEAKWSDAVSDDFLKNAVRARVEGRFGISVNQPLAIVKVATAA